MEFWNQLANQSTSGTSLNLTDFKTSAVDIAGYMTDDDGTFLGTIWYKNYRIDGFGISIGDPESVIERSISLIGEDEISLTDDNAYLVHKKFTAAGATPESLTVSNPTPIVDPDNSGQYLYKVTRYNGTSTTVLTYESGSGDPSSDTQFTYDSGTLKVNTSAGDTVRAYYSAGSYVSGSSTFTNNDVDAASISADSCTIYLETSDTLYRLQSVGIDVTFDRLDIKEIGNDEVVARGVRDITTNITLGRILEDFTIEEVLRGEGADHGKIDIRKFSDDIKLTVKVYSDSTKDTFLIGYQFTDLTPVSLETGVPLSDYINRGTTLQGESGLITTSEGSL